MNAITYTAARGNLAKTMKQVCNNHDPVIITRKNNESVVMISMEDYESLNETAYLFHSSKNVKRLFDAVNELNQGKGKTRKLLK